MTQPQQAECAGPEGALVVSRGASPGEELRLVLLGCVIIFKLAWDSYEKRRKNYKLIAFITSSIQPSQLRLTIVY